MKRLFDKIKIGNMDVKNRFVRSVLCDFLANTDGHNTNEAFFNYYEELSKGGVGTIITSFAKVDKNDNPNSRMIGIYDDSFIDEYKILTKNAHKHDTKILIQIVYVGSQSYVLISALATKNPLDLSMGRVSK